MKNLYLRPLLLLIMVLCTNGTKAQESINDADSIVYVKCPKAYRYRETLRDKKSNEFRLKKSTFC